MIKNLEEIKNELSQLSAVINSFQSEAVQLRIVELILGENYNSSESSIDSVLGNKYNKKRSKKNNQKKIKSETGIDQRVRKTSKIGPNSILNELIDESFFATPKSIKQITEYSESSKGKKIKSGDFSSSLVRFVRDKKLTRTKNNDGQYEYEKFK